ncbi:unnamed protein product [Orchesella dallaii]|uniref:Uncharacterized protein n=1 Tax=Orchesella dallaii TaxID=48710 RepID=A0ABP1RF96_9HEXA
MPDILGDPKEFNMKLTYFASRQPVVIDVYAFPNNHGRYNIQELISNPKSGSFFKTKYSYCSTQLYFPVYYPRVQMLMGSIHNSLHAMVLLNENPHFVIYMFTQLTKALELEFHVTNLWNSISLTSVPVFATRGYARLICLTCYHPLENPLGNLLDSGNIIPTKEKLNSAAEILSHNLNQKALRWMGNVNPKILEKSSCSLNRDLLETPYGQCSIFTLLQKYNFSLYNRRIPNHHTKIIGELLNGQAMSRTGIHQTFLEVVTRRRIRNAWIPYGCVYKPYKYVAFLSKQHAVNFMSIFQPFDITTGCMLLASILSLVVVATCLLKMLELLDIQHPPLTAVLLFPVKSLIEQSDSYMVATFRYRFGGYFLISSWLFLCYIIGNEYKGFMYSSMTSSPIQPVPESMIELVMFSDMPYFTTTKHGYKGKLYSTLTDMVIVDMDTGEENFLKQFFSRFRNQVSLIYGFETAVINNITKNLPVDTHHGMKLIRKKFAVISTEEDIEFFVGLMKKLTDYYIIPNKKVSPFVSRVPWFGRRNNFIKLATLGIARLVESGIYDRWIKHMRQSKLIWNLKNVDKKLNTTSDNYYAMIVLSDSQLTKQTQQGSMISFQSIDLVFKGCSALLLISLLIFLIELMANRLCNTMNRANTTQVIYF